METSHQTPGDGHDIGEAAQLINAHDLARRLGVKTNTVHVWAKDGRIPCMRVGQKTIRFDADAVLAALAANGRRRVEGGRRG